MNDKKSFWVMALVAVGCVSGCAVPNGEDPARQAPVADIGAAPQAWAGESDNGIAGEQYSGTSCGLVAKPASLEFGCPVGTTQKLRTYVTNTGKDAVKIIGPEMPASAFELAGIIGPEIPAGATIAIDIVFTPTNATTTKGVAGFQCGIGMLTLSGTGY